MYLGNTNLRGPDQKVTMTKKQISEYIHCKEDMLYFAENYFYVVDNDKGKHKIQLREFQKRMLKAFISPTDNKRYCCVLAPRQVGKCFFKDTKIKIRNKKTGEIREISIENFFESQKTK